MAEIYNIFMFKFSFTYFFFCIEVINYIVDFFNISMYLFSHITKNLENMIFNEYIIFHILKDSFIVEIFISFRIFHLWNYRTKGLKYFHSTYYQQVPFKKGCPIYSFS